MQISESLRWPSKGHHRDQEVIEKVQQLCAEYGREEEGGFDKTNICQGRLSHNLPIQSKLNILQWMKFSMCKRGLCTHWLIWLFRKWVGIETMKLWVQWLWGEGSYRSILLLFGRSLDVSCLIHGYYTYVSCLIRTVPIHTIVEAACTLVVSTKIERLCGQCHGHRSLWHRKIACWCFRRRKNFLLPNLRMARQPRHESFLWGFFGVMCFILLGQSIYALSKYYKSYKNLAQQCCNPLF